MNIYGSLKDIFDEKNKDIYVETMRQPNPERGYSWTFKNNNS